MIFWKSRFACNYSLREKLKSQYPKTDLMYILEKTTRPKVLKLGLYFPWVNIYRSDEGIWEIFLFSDFMGQKLPKIGGHIGSLDVWALYYTQYLCGVNVTIVTSSGLQKTIPTLILFLLTEVINFVAVSNLLFTLIELTKSRFYVQVLFRLIRQYLRLHNALLSLLYRHFILTGCHITYKGCYFMNIICTRFKPGTRTRGGLLFL